MRQHSWLHLSTKTGGVPAAQLEVGALTRYAVRQRRTSATLNHQPEGEHKSGDDHNPGRSLRETWLRSRLQRFFRPRGKLRSHKFKKDRHFPANAGRIQERIRRFPKQDDDAVPLDSRALCSANVTIARSGRSRKEQPMKPLFRYRSSGALVRKSYNPGSQRIIRIRLRPRNQSSHFVRWAGRSGKPRCAPTHEYAT